MSGELLHADVTAVILKAFYHVYGTLGYGFLEKVYENAMVLTLRRLGVSVRQQQPTEVFFEGTIVGEYYADLVVSDCVVVELKAAEDVSPAHEAQLLNYLRATDIEVGLLLNFGKRPDFREGVLRELQAIADRGERGTRQVVRFGCRRARP